MPFHVFVREWVLNATWPVCLWLMITISTYLTTWKKHRSRPWYQDASLRAELAMLLFDTGVFLRAIWVWILLFVLDHGGTADNVDDWWVIDVLGGLLTVIGGTWKVYEIAPQNYGKRLAWATFITTVLSVAIPHLYLGLGNINWNW